MTTIISCAEPEKHFSRPIAVDNDQNDTVSVSIVPNISNETDTFHSNADIKQFIKILESNKYFSYCDKTQKAIVMDSIISGLKNFGEFQTAYSTESPYSSLDSRFYNCFDGEGLYERGGVIEKIIEMRPLFKRIKLELAYSEDTYNGAVHSIHINDRTYILANGDGPGWGETIYRFTDLLNKELRLQGIKERFYILTNNSDESTSLVFLSDKQFEIINSFLKAETQLRTPDEWVAFQKKNN